MTILRLFKERESIKMECHNRPKYHATSPVQNGIFYTAVRLNHPVYLSNLPMIQPDELARALDLKN